MHKVTPHHGLGTLVMHYDEGTDPWHAHIMPIYQTSLFSFPDFETSAAIYEGRIPGYTYTRTTNPNTDHLARKVALLEGLDLIRAQPDISPDDLVAGKTFGSGMAAISSAILARVKSGDTILAQHSLYSNTFNFLTNIAPRLGIQVVWVDDTSPTGWEAVLRNHPNTRLIYAETPANPTMLVVDLAELARLTHLYETWLMVDNTFATPYCQRPLSLGADVVVHSTTKYLSGHGIIIGGMVVSTHLDYIHQDLQLMLRTLGGAASPFDAWLANMGLKTFELRMERHCSNALAVAGYLEDHPAVLRVCYPGLASHPGYPIAKKQMQAFGGMLSFELKGGLESGAALMSRLEIATLGVSLGNVDGLIQHPATMTHASVPPEERHKMGISDGLVRFSVGAENIEDILADLEQALIGL
jgi:methionine-gamma-lyase